MPACENVSQTYIFLYSLSLSLSGITSQFPAMSISITLFSLSLWILLHHFLLFCSSFSFIGVIPLLFLYLCSLPLLCLCIILSLTVAHNAPHSHPPPSHILAEHKQASVWIKHLRQCTRWAPLECQDEHWYSDRGLWPHTVSVDVSVCYWVLDSVSHRAARVITSVFLHVLLSEGRRSKKPCSVIKLYRFDK